MKQRGRKSGAEMAVVSPLSNGLAKPPAHHNDDQAQHWSQIIASKPADWWDAGTFPLLDAYVRTIVEYQRISELADACHPIESGDDFKNYEALHKVQDRLASQLARLATKMRLSQQSNYGARGADGASDKGNGKRPWLD